MNKFTYVRSLLSEDVTETLLVEGEVLATGSYQDVMNKLHNIDNVAAMASAEFKNTNGIHKGKTDTYYTTEVGGKFYLTKDKPLSTS
jgi:hypothetical protein